MEYIRVLVTGAGSGVGQGIIKALNISSLPLKIISADISSFNCALYRTNEAVIIPKVEERNALKKLIDIINKNRVNVVLIGSEFDLAFFSDNKEIIETQTDAVVIASPSKTVKIANDKWLTVEFLRKNYLPYPESYLPINCEEALNVAEDWGYPFLIKPRFGTSNRHVFIIKNYNEMKSIFQRVPKPVMQKIIHMPSSQIDNEYTCSVFKTNDGSILGPFTARRTLKNGNSWIVEVDYFKTFYPLLLSIGEKLEITGSLNIQLMLGKNGPVPFEFNARFSGTTAIRAYFGFNEPEMSIRNFYLKEKLSEVKIAKGLTFRYLEEVFIDDINCVDLIPSSSKGKVIPWF